MATLRQLIVNGPFPQAGAGDNALLAFGVDAARRLSVDAFPDVTNVQVQVLTKAPALVDIGLSGSKVTDTTGLPLASLPAAAAGFLLSLAFEPVASMSDEPKGLELGEMVVTKGSFTLKTQMQKGEMGDHGH